MLMISYVIANQFIYFDLCSAAKNVEGKDTALPIPENSSTSLELM